MEIQSPCVVALTWRLEDAQGQLIDELAQPVEFFYGGADLLEKVEASLLGEENPLMRTHTGQMKVIMYLREASSCLMKESPRFVPLVNRLVGKGEVCECDPL